MGNRILKESICTSEKIDELDLIGEVTFYRLLVNCDDYGVMDARPKILKARLFPLKEDISSSQISAAIANLARIGLIRLYECDGKPYLQVQKWAEHQRIRDSKHKYPMPEDADSTEPEQPAESCEPPQNDNESGELQQSAATCGEPRRNAARARAESESESESNTNPNPTRTRTRARGTETDQAFDAFWAEYPNRVAKQDAVKAWKKLHPDEVMSARIMAGLRKWITSDEWTRDDGRYIPHPATWLNGRRWEDEIRQRRAGTQVGAQAYEQREYASEAERPEEMLRRLSAEGV